MILLKSPEPRGKELSQHRALQKSPGSACTSVLKKDAGIKTTLQVQCGQMRRNGRVLRSVCWSSSSRSLMLHTYRGLFVFMFPVCLVVLRERNKQGAVGWQSPQTRQELPMGLAGSLQWKERAVELQLLCKALQPDPAPLNRALCRSRGCPDRAAYWFTA